MEDVIARVREDLEPSNQRDARARLAEQLSAVDRQAMNLADAIAMGGDMPALVERLQQAQQQRQALAGELEAMPAGLNTVRIDWRVLERQARRLLIDWRGLLARHASDASSLLRELLEAPLLFTPILEETRRGDRFEGAIKSGGLIAGIVGGNELGVPGQI